MPHFYTIESGLGCAPFPLYSQAVPAIPHPLHRASLVPGQVPFHCKAGSGLGCCPHAAGWSPAVPAPAPGMGL